METKFGEFSSDAFFDNYKVKFDELSMRAGMGQKYGRPKREFFIAMQKPSHFFEDQSNAIRSTVRTLLAQTKNQSCSHYLALWDTLRFQLKALGEFLTCLKSPLEFENVKYYFSKEIEEKKADEAEPFMESLEKAMAKWKEESSKRTKEFYKEHGKHEVVGSCDSEITPEQEQDMAEIRKRLEGTFAEWRESFKKMVTLKE